MVSWDWGVLGLPASATQTRRFSWSRSALASTKRGKQIKTRTPRALRPMTAAQRRCDRIRFPDALDQHVDAIAAPEQFAVEDHGRHAEDTEDFGFIDDVVVLGPRHAVDVSLERLGRAADRRDHARNVRQLVDFEVMTPEATEYRVVIGAEQAMALREQHAGAGIEGVIDARGPFMVRPCALAWRRASI